VAGQPATSDPNFWTEFGNFLPFCGESTADDSEFPFLTEENPVEAWVRDGGNGVFSRLSSWLFDSQNIPSEVSGHDHAQEQTSTVVSNVEEGPMDFETTWDPDVPSTHPETPCSYTPESEPETVSKTLLTPVSAVFSIPDNTNGGNPPVVLTGPSGSQRVSVIMPGPALANKPLTTQPKHGKPMNPSVENTGGNDPFVIQVTPIKVQISPAPSACSAPRGKKVPKSNPERCRDYRNRQKTKKEKDEEELRQLDAKNRALKAKEAALRNKIRRIKEAARRMGLGNYFN